MSKIVPIVASCSSCGHEQQLRVYESLNAERLPDQVELIARGEFELSPCPGCGVAYQPEHRMLFADFSNKVWLVMQPASDRAHFTTLERGVERVMSAELVEAPPPLVDDLVGIRPRLVFGHAMLAESVRAARAGLDATLLECAKLVAIRGELGRFLNLGPVELCFEGIEPTGELSLSVIELSSGNKVETVRLPADAIDVAASSQRDFQIAFPELFERPYISACRYLYGSAA